MLKISRLETRFQEIVFLLTITFSVAIAVGGLCYLMLSPQSFVQAFGATGSSMIKSGFTTFGYSYFFFVIFLLHMGHLALGTAMYVRDLVQMHRVYLRSSAIYLAVLVLISSFLTVLESFNQWEISNLLLAGYGGEVGTALGGYLFSSFGLFGALVLLFTVTSVIGISAGYMEIVHSFYVMKDIFTEMALNIRTHGPELIKALGERVVDFVDQKPQYAVATVNTPVRAHVQRSAVDRRQAHRSSMHPLMQGGRLMTEHFHMPEEAQSAIEEPVVTQDELKEMVEDVEAPVVAEAPAKKTRRRSSKKIEEVAVEVPGAEAKAQPQEDVSESDEVKEEKVEIAAWTKRYKKIDSNLLEKPEKIKKRSEQEINQVRQMLKERLESFGIRGEVIAAHQGVTLTMYEFQPAAGMKISKIQGLGDDLALVLGAKAIRILAPIPGKSTVGIEVPNSDMSILRFSEMVNECGKSKSMNLPIPLGLDVNNKAHVNDLAKMPHILISGTTGSGKSVFMNSLISGLIYHKSPKDLRFLMIDPKMIELSPYNGIPHLLKPVITNVDEAKNLLLWAEKEMDKRYQMFADIQAKNITSFNDNIKKGSKRSVEGRLGKKIDWKFEHMPYIVIVIDELADLMLTHRQEVERPITRIAQKARAAGIHMVIATQRPSSDIVTGLIKTNFPTRVSFKVSSSIDSRTILDQSGAEKLLGNGDMLYMAQGKAIERLQGSFMTEDEVKKVVRAVTAQGATKKK